MSLVLNIADSIVADLNAATLSLPVTAHRLYVPNFQLEDMNELRVSVVPRELQISSLDRARNQHDVDIDVAIQKKFKTGDAAEIDPLVSLAEEIADFFRLQRLASFSAAIWSRTEHRVLYSQEHWDQMNQFTSLLTLTFRIAR